MSLAYHILAHKSPAQVARLFRAIYHPEDVFVLHFDRRAPAALHELGRELRARHPNVILQTPQRVLWSGPQISNLQLAAMALALRYSRWNHFINLAGQDFPLTSREARLAQLSPHPRTTYLSWFRPLETQNWRNARERIERWHLHSTAIERVLKIPGLGRRLRALLGWANQVPFLPFYRRPSPNYFAYYGGSNWGIFSRAACRYLTENPDAQRIERWLDRAAPADEIVFQSVLLTSPLADTIVNENWREIDFAPHTSHPKTFTSADYDRLMRCGKLFARKFDDSVDSAILDRLEERLQPVSAAS